MKGTIISTYSKLEVYEVVFVFLQQEFGARSHPNSHIEAIMIHLYVLI
jgi:hypothetical protein